MAFNCTYDTAVNNLQIDSSQEVDDADVTTLINAVNELKDYLNTQGNFNAGISSSPIWGSTNIIHHSAVTSIRTVIEDIDPQTVCSCDYVCDSDQACSCNSQYTTCTCEHETHCSNDCSCKHQTTNCSCDTEVNCSNDCTCNHESSSCTCDTEVHCSNNCSCNHQTTNCTCDTETHCSPNCDCNNVS